jgi:hypothetical protein
MVHIYVFTLQPIRTGSFSSHSITENTGTSSPAFATLTKSTRNCSKIVQITSSFATLTKIPLVTPLLATHFQNKGVGAGVCRSPITASHKSLVRPSSSFCGTIFCWLTASRSHQQLIASRSHQQLIASRSHKQLTASRSRMQLTASRSRQRIDCLVVTLTKVRSHGKQNHSRSRTPGKVQSH